MTPVPSLPSAPAGPCGPLRLTPSSFAPTWAVDAPELTLSTVYTSPAASTTVSPTAMPSEGDSEEKATSLLSVTSMRATRTLRPLSPFGP